MELKSENKTQQKGKSNLGSIKMKTEICRNWKSGKCRYGDNCFFAHGDKDLRIISARENKVVKCQQFHDFGYCKFGFKCMFKHQEKTEESIAEAGLGESKNDDSRKRLPIFLKLSEELIITKI